MVKKRTVNDGALSNAAFIASIFYGRDIKKAQFKVQTDKS
jgi:hypothetical protein